MGFRIQLHFPEIPLISCIHVFSCGTVVLINKIWAQYEFCAQIMLLVSGGLGFQWVGSRPVKVPFGKAL